MVSTEAAARVTGALLEDETAAQDHAEAHGGDRVAAALAAHGVTALFTLCGGHISPILTGAKARGIRIIDTRAEATAVFAADAVARLTGVPGIAAVTAGPGITNTATALKNAQLAQSPVILLGGASWEGRRRHCCKGAALCRTSISAPSPRLM
jgi:thiamine pyrophosphate-dependent acetolactate synthase large subunit-like protein